MQFCKVRTYKPRAFKIILNILLFACVETPLQYLTAQNSRKQRKY